jgi:hypothetical protein
VASLSAVGAAPAAPSKTQAAAAAPAKAKVAAADALAVETDGPAATGSTKPAEGAGCLRSRRKLWVDGEGWIVRRVTLCP